ncbi:MAG: Uncharacterised protein [Prochlorococcus marinus str. MIT 9215]|nr:MAG: Uncharacterised protein [Prochlorococcus marinus str. MIT 9215]
MLRSIEAMGSTGTALAMSMGTTESPAMASHLFMETQSPLITVPNSVVVVG